MLRGGRSNLSFIYDDKDRLISISNTDDNGNVTVFWENAYDEAGNLIKTLRYRSMVTTLPYDEEYFATDAGKEQRVILTTTYDEAGNILVLDSKCGMSIMNYTYEYEYYE